LAYKLGETIYRRDRTFGTEGQPCINAALASPCKHRETRLVPANDASGLA